MSIRDLFRSNIDRSFNPGMSSSTSRTQLDNSFVWSCRFFPGIRSAYELAEEAGGRANCLYCNAGLHGAENDWTGKLTHLVFRHRYRACTQELYTSITGFEEHLRCFHLFDTQSHVIESDSVAVTASDDEEPATVTIQAETVNAQIFPFLSMASDRDWEVPKKIDVLEYWMRGSTGVLPVGVSD
jgi:hypothetical protein